MSIAFGIEVLAGVALLFGGGAWFFSEFEALSDRQRRSGSVFVDFLLLGAPMGMVAILVAAVGGYILWNAIVGGAPLLDPDAVRPWLPDRFSR